MPRDALTAETAARLLLEGYLAEYGETVCLASLPLVIDEIAASEAGGDPATEQALVATLRRRAGLHVAAPRPV